MQLVFSFLVDLFKLRFVLLDWVTITEDLDQPLALTLHVLDGLGLLGAIDSTDVALLLSLLVDLSRTQVQSFLLSVGLDDVGGRVRVHRVSL